MTAGVAGEAAGAVGPAGASEPFGVAVVGCGNISKQYLKNLATFPDVQVLFCADIDPGRAKAQAAAYGVPASGSPEQALEHPDVQLVVNLTIPAAHAEVASAAIAAGKHVWNEKPLAPDVAAGRALLEQARAAGLRVGCAPDTMLGAGIQSARRLIASGAIGTPLSALILFQGQGPESWHPDPEFLFARGAGPLFDIGPYYLTTMVQLLGPIAKVEAAGHRARAQRVIGAGPDAGTTFPVEVDTHVSVLTTFRSGVVGTSVYSFDSAVSRQAFEISGAHGTMEVPVSGFDGPTRLLREPGPDASWETIAPPGESRDRGVGVLEMARAIRAGRPPRASGQLAFHVLDVLLAIEESAASGQPVPVTSTADPVPPLDEDWSPATPTLRPERAAQ